MMDRSALVMRCVRPGLAALTGLSLLGVAVGVTPASAQAPAPQTSSEPAAGQGAPVPPLPLPSQSLVTALVRSTLIALQHANATGNYTVLRDLGSPIFQAANNSARLGQIFQSLRENRIDLSDALLEMPQLMLQPTFDGDGRLRLVGFIPSDTQRIHFDLLFQPVAGNWQIFGISIKPVPVPQKPPADTHDGSSIKPLIPPSK